jgi:glycosyltransferase involved in cell wall biosynthesis
MKVIHIVLGKLNTNRQNGVNKVVHDLATQLVLNNVDMEVWGISKNQNHDYPERCYTTHLFKAHNNPFKIDSLLKDALCKLEKDTTIHLHGGWIPLNYSLSRFLQKLNIKYILTPHGSYNTYAMKRSNWRKKIYYYLFEQFVTEHAKTVHCIGQSEIAGLLSLSKIAKPALFPYGFEKNNNIQKQNQENKLSEIIIGFCGRLDMHTKGLDVLFNAFKLYQDKNINAKLWIIGSGQDEIVLKALSTTLNLNQNVIFFGGKYGREKFELLSKCTYFIHPSRNEGLPSAVLEAASIGLPLLVSEATNTSNYVQKYNAGIAIKNLNCNELAVAMFQMETKIKNHPILISENAKRMVEVEFNWKDLISKYQEMYFNE